MTNDQPTNESSIDTYIRKTFSGLDVVTLTDAIFYFYDPEQKLPPKQRMPFATLVNSDHYDQASNLSRPSVYRLNIGISKETYRAMFGAQPSYPEGNGVVDTGHDFSTLDQIMPHPVYAPASWICVLNPSSATFQQVRKLLAEAYELAVARHAHLLSQE